MIPSALSRHSVLHIQIRGAHHAPGVRAFAERVRAVSSHPVIYAELPGAYHDFDLYESIRSAAVSQAVEQFTGQTAFRPAAPAGS